MMTGIPIENNLWTAYLLTIFFVVAGFAVYDVLYRRVPDWALVFFIPLAALAPVLQGYFLLNHGLPPLFLWPVATHALVGALLGFCIPLAAALATNGTGLGGGDIKFCGILGLVYGPSGMALVSDCRCYCNACDLSSQAALSNWAAPCYPVPAISRLRLLYSDLGPTIFKIGDNAYETE